ncbi:MAG: hypothetical protein JO040_04410 [Gemmatimonadetes bacterium]|nr:hypothetical protein [Gemmatimonadota bacterium]
MRNASLPFPPDDETRLDREVWRTRGAMARAEARELREQARQARWFSRQFRDWCNDLVAERQAALKSLER